MKTTSYLSNHPKSHLQCWSNQLWLRSRVTDRPFSEAGKFFKTVLPCLGKVWQSFSLCPAYPVQIPCTLSVVEAWAVPCWKANCAKKKTNSKWSVFSAQHSIRNRLVLSEATMSHVNRTLSYLNAMFHKSLKWLKITYLCRIQSSMYLKNLINLTIGITHMNNYWPIIFNTCIT